jgi:hypothetical protein
MVGVKSTAKRTIKGIVFNGGKVLAGLTLARVVMSPMIGDNTILSTGAKGVSGVLAAQYLDPKVGYGILADAADDLLNVVGIRPGAAGAGVMGNGGQSRRMV